MPKDIPKKNDSEEQEETPDVSLSQVTHDLTSFEKKLVRNSVLLVEDDESFSEQLKLYLTAHGFTVQRARNGGEGVKKILMNDFDAIVCDMMMPNFPGDMFYRAVQLTKPYLCERFIFMTGHRGERHITDFIREIKGLMLWKPFQLHVLIEAIRTKQNKAKLIGE